MYRRPTYVHTIWYPIRIRGIVYIAPKAFCWWVPQTNIVVRCTINVYIYIPQTQKHTEILYCFKEINKAFLWLLFYALHICATYDWQRIAAFHTNFAARFHKGLIHREHNTPAFLLLSIDSSLTNTRYRIYSRICLVLKCGISTIKYTSIGKKQCNAASHSE